MPEKRFNRRYNWGIFRCIRCHEIQEKESFDKLVALVPWHRKLNEDFSQEAIELWGGPINSRTALAYDATLTLIKALELQEKPTRKGTQKQLADPNFEVNGVTGKIQFCPNNGDRKNSPGIFVEVKETNNKGDLNFVPLLDKEQVQITDIDSNRCKAKS